MTDIDDDIEVEGQVDGTVPKFDDISASGAKFYEVPMDLFFGWWATRRWRSLIVFLPSLALVTTVFVIVTLGKNEPRGDLFERYSDWYALETPRSLALSNEEVPNSQDLAKGWLRSRRSLRPCCNECLNCSQTTSR